MRKEKTLELTDADEEVKPKTTLRKRKTHEMSVYDDETPEPQTKKGTGKFIFHQHSQYRY